MSFRGKTAPRNYVAGVGRGAAGFTTRSDVGPATASAPAGTGSRSSSVFGGGQGQAPPPKDVGDAAVEGGQYDDDDDEADQVWAAIDERMRSRRRKKRRKQKDTEEAEDTTDDDGGGRQQARARIGSQFRELKEKLADVTEDQWASIPDVGDYSLKYKQPSRRQQQDVFTPLTDSLIEQRSKTNLDATAGTAALAGTATAEEEGFKSVVANMSGLSAARGTVLGMSLDRTAAAASSSNSTSGLQTQVVDPQGYLTSLSNTQIATTAEVADINKARLLLKSVRATNQKHGPGWIASARVEEAAGKTLQARKIIQEACEVCPDSEDVWLEAARLHPPAVAQSILATAVRRIPTSVRLFLKAADLEHTDAGKKAVLRKALEANPTSVTLWKAAIELEDAEDARILLAVAVERVPQSVEMWLALARLETYARAQKVLNKARKALPSDRSIWIAAAKLEESQNHNDTVDKVIERAVKSLQKNEAVVTRAQWLQEAESAEMAGAPITSAAIVKYTIGLDVDDEDRQRTWSEDAKGAMARGSIATARAILTHALTFFRTKRSLWMQAVDLERKHGNATTLDEVLAAASERLPHVDIFWLLRAKEQWLSGKVEAAREILTKAFAANPESYVSIVLLTKLLLCADEVIFTHIHIVCFFLQGGRVVSCGQARVGEWRN